MWNCFGGFVVNFEHISHLFSSVSIVKYENVIAGWLLLYQCAKRYSNCDSPMTLQATSIFHQAYPKLLTCKKSLLDSFILEIQPVLQSCDNSKHARFLTTANAKIYQSWISWVCIDMQKIRLLHNFVSKMQLIWNLGIWLVERIEVHNS